MVTIPAQDDAEEFSGTLEAMRIMGLNEEEITAIFRVLSGTLMFGNMEFKQVCKYIFGYLFMYRTRAYQTPTCH